MVLLVDPDEEGLVVVVVDTASLRPEVAGIRLLQVTIALLEQEVVVDQLLLRLLRHAVQRVVLALNSEMISCYYGRCLITVRTRITVDTRITVGVRLLVR